MDLFGGMPQVKTAVAVTGNSVYTTVPIDQSELSNQSLGRAADVAKYKSDILASSAWSAVIHHPAEDSEPDELPSTVDMDAIKEPPTPLPAPCTPGGTIHSQNEDEEEEDEEEEGDDEDDDDDSESDSDDADSDSETGNESNTESEEGGSRSDGEAGVGTLSESESEESQGSAVIGGAATRRRYRRSSSTSSHSSLSDSSNGGGGNKQQLKQKKKEKKKIASPEMAYEQGGEHYYRSRQTDPANPMKVKISALKLSSSKQQQQQQQHRPSSGHQLVASSIRLRSSRTKLVNDVVTSQSAPVTATPTAAAKKRNAAIDAKQATGSEVSSSDEDGDGEEEEDEEDDDDDDRRERGGEEEKDEITQLAQEFVRPSSTLPISEHLQVINQEDLAAILPDVVGVGGGPFDGFEDVNGSGPTSQGPAAAAAAAARKAAAGKGGGRVGELEGGDDVGGGGGGGETETSSSDTEMLPDVTAVINRIDRMDDDSDGQRASGASDDEDDDDEDDGDDAESETDERFNQQTEQISAGNRGGVRPVLEATEGAGSRRRRGRPPKLTVAATSSGSCIHHHHKHHHHHQPGGAGAPPELEPVYCSASNVSPDSGIQSVAGSPAHHQLCASPSPPQAAPLSQRHHSPANSAATTGRVPANSVAPPPRRGKKAGTGDAGDARHFGRTPETITKNVPPYDKTSSRSARPVEADEEAEEVDEKEEEEEEEHLLPRLLHAGPMAAGGKRGPGRPKKTPPTLEPNLPIGEQHKRTTTARKEGHHHHHHHHHHKHRHHHHHHNLQHSNSNNSLLNEICEQVSKRLDIVDDASQSQTPPPPLLSLNGEMKKKQPKLKPTRRHHHNKHNHNKHRHEGTSSSKSFPLKLQLEHRLKTAPLKVKPTYVAKNGRRHSSVTGLAVGKHHKHKKRKRRSSGMDMKSGTFKLVDPNFLTDLDQLVGVFDKLCHIRPRPKSPTLSVDVKKVGQECVVADVKKLSPPGQEASKKLSPIDRTKMVDVKSSPAVGGRSLSKNGGASSKKRKAEKVGRNCEKESVVVGVVVVEGSENVVGGVVDQQQSVVVSPAATVKRSRVKKTSAIGGEVLSKSRGDKPSVEVTSANNNEQRLPLKKRHYHMSTSTPQHQSAVDWESSSPDSSDAKSGSGKSKSDSSSVASSESLTLGGKAKSADTTRSGLSKSVGGSAQVLEKSKAGITKPDALEVEEEAGGGKMAAELVSEQQHRDSIDEAIEACINKYSDGDCVVGGEGGGASLISTTPKKRHRIDVDEKREGVQMKGVGKPQATVTSASQPKRASSRSLSATNHHSLTATSTTTPAVTARVKRTSSRIAVPVTVTTASSQNHSGVTSKRVSARSASATVESTATKTAVSATAVPSKRPHLRSSSSSTTTNTLTTTSATTTTTATMTTASSGQVLSTSTNVDKSKRTTSRHAAVTPSGTTTTPSRSTQTKPPAGVFEPSTKIDDLVSCLPKITPLPPVKAVRPAVIHVLNKLTERLKGLEEVVDEKTDEVSVFRSLRTKRAAEDETDQEEASVSRSLRTQRVQEVASDDDLLKCNSKKRKLLKDVRVHVTKLLPSDLVVAKDEVAAVVVKQKVKRRKAINRTGFPAKKKKKKKVVVAAVLEDGCSPLPPPVLEDQTKLVPVDCPLFVDVTPALSPMMTVTPRTKCDETADRLQQEPITTPRRPARESVRQKSVSVGSSSNNNNNNNNNAVLDIKSVIQELKSRKDSVMERKRKEKEEADLMSREDKEEKRKRMKESVEEVELRLGDVVGGSVEVEDRTRRKKKGDEEEEDNEEEECEDGEKGERTRRTKKEKGVVVVMNSRRPQRKAAQPKNDEKKKEEKDSCKEETEMKENLEDSSKKRQMVEKKRTDGKVVERRSLKDITCDRKQKDKVKKKEEEDGGVVVGGGEEREVGGGVGLDKKSVERKLKDVIEKRTRLKEEAVVERKARKTNEETIEVEEVKVEEEEEKVMQDEKSPQDECGGGGGGGGLSSSSCKKIRHKSPRHSHNRRTEASRRRKRKRNGLIKHKKRKGKSKVGVMRSGRIRSKRMKQKSGEAERDENNCSDEDKLAPSRQPPVAVATSPPRRRKKKVSVPRWRKRYLAAGLFSDLYKTEAGEQLRRPALDASGSRTVYRPEEHQWGLMPPPHYCAKWVRQRRVPFQLPHDLWWLHKNSRLPGRDVVPSWNHKKIRTNVYYDVKPSYMYEAQACNCNLPPPPTSQQQLIPAAQPSKVMTSATNGCGEDCINRLIYTECSPRLCPCRQLCTNQRIQRHEWAPGLVKFMTPNKGWGVKTKHAIRTGEFILEYVGEVVSEREFKNRMASRYHSDTHHYCLNLDGGLVIDGHRMGGDGRFVNHSCEPNCEMQKWSVNGLFRMALFALRDIEPHEELTYDYNFALFNPAEGQPCKCGSRKCRGVIGGKYQRVSVIKESQENASSLTKSRKKSRKGQVDPKQSKGGGVANKSSVGSAAAAAKETVNKETQASSSGGVGSTGTATLATIRANQLLPPKPLTAHQQELVKSSRVLLLRNFEKVKRCREKLKQRSVSLAAAAAVKDATAAAAADPAATTTAAGQDGSGVFLSQLNALSTARNVRTRRLKQAQDDPEVTRVARLAHLLRGLHAAVANAKEENGESLASGFAVVPSKRRQPDYHELIQSPIDLNTIEARLKANAYRDSVVQFDGDMRLLFANCQRYFGRVSQQGKMAARLARVYATAKRGLLAQIEQVLGEPVPASFVEDDGVEKEKEKEEQEEDGDEAKGGGVAVKKAGEEEDVIRCVCGMLRDEGVMIQCERCLVWQHCDCVRADAGVEHYLCERCDRRAVDKEIRYDTNPEYATEGQIHYMTLLRGQLQVRQGDTVYVLRDIPNEETGTSTTPPSKHNYKTIKVINYNDCDIFRIERLWKDEKGDRFVFGHHYLRPHETYHEPTRKFFTNEVMRVPLYEVVPIELVMGHCYVLDPATYCKGRPRDADMRHVYICEYRVDKTARLFAKLARPRQPPVCTKSYAFDKYEQRLKISRTYTPHGPPPSSNVTSSGSSSSTSSSSSSSTTTASKNGGSGAVSRNRGGRSTHAQEEQQRGCDRQDAVSVVMTTNAATNTAAGASQLPVAKRADQKQRLNEILLRLLARAPSKQVLDISYLLEPGRRNRKRPALLSP